MARLNSRRRQFGQPPIKPCDVFDLIGGTRTGGLIAIMLGRLEMDVDECMQAYIKFARESFKEILDTTTDDRSGKPKLQSKQLHNAAETLVRDNGIPEQALLNDGRKRKCKTFVCTIDSSTKHPVRLRDYDLDDELPIPVTVRDAIQATFAATTFFEPIKIGHRTFSSGIMGTNNPAPELEGEAMSIWCPRTSRWIDLVKCFLSVGTGNPGLQPFGETSGYLNKDLVDLVAETERTETTCVARWAKLLEEKRYFRFNVEQGLQKVGLYEYDENRLGLIEGTTESYLSHQAQKFRIRDCVHNLHQKRNHTLPDFSYILQRYRSESFGLYNSASWRNASRTSRLPPPAPSVLSDASTDSNTLNMPFLDSALLRSVPVKRAQVGATLAALLLSTGCTRAEEQRIMVCILGDSSKTADCLIYAKTHRKRYRGVFWVDASTLASVEDSFLKIATTLGVDPSIGSVKSRLATRLESWLLVFDNADDPSLLIPYFPDGDRGHIIITSRSLQLKQDILRDYTVKQLLVYDTTEMEDKSIETLASSHSPPPRAEHAFSGGG